MDSHCLYIFYTTGFGSDCRKHERKFNYSTKEKWDDARIRKTIEEIKEKKYSVKRIELLERDRLKPNISIIPIPQPIQF